MANISQYLTNIKNALYGREVRSSIHDALEAINENAMDAKESAIAASQNHATLFRGKNLGSFLTVDHIQAIESGTFEDLYLGDYWVIGGVVWRIVDFDYWYGVYSTDFTIYNRHHLVIMPDTSIGYGVMYNGNDFTLRGGSYLNSDMHKTGLNSYIDLVREYFTLRVIAHPEYLTGYFSSSGDDISEKTNVTMCIPNSIMIFGMQHPTRIDKSVTYCNKQLSLFKIAPKFIRNDSGFWLRDQIGGVQFANVDFEGCFGSSFVNNLYEIRPYFCIG